MESKNLILIIAILLFWLFMKFVPAAKVKPVGSLKPIGGMAL